MCVGNLDHYCLNNNNCATIYCLRNFFWQIFLPEKELLQVNSFVVDGRFTHSPGIADQSLSSSVRKLLANLL